MPCSTPPSCARGGRRSGSPQLTDAELLTLAVLQALLDYVSEARWLRYARTHLRDLFPYLPRQSGYNKRLRAAFPLLSYFIRALAVDTELWSDTVWVADSTPVECGRSRDTVRRSALAGRAAYGYGRSHTRYFWGLRLHLVCTLHGLPVAFALANPKTDEREVLVELLDVEPGLLAERPGPVILVDKGYRDAETEAILAAQGVTVLRPAYNGEAPRPGRGCLGRCGSSSSRSTTPSRASSGPRQRWGMHQMSEYACGWNLPSDLDQRRHVALARDARSRTNGTNRDFDGALVSKVIWLSGSGTRASTHALCCRLARHPR